MRSPKNHSLIVMGVIGGFVAMIASTGSAESPAAELQNIPLAQLGQQYQLVGMLHVPLMKVVTIEGVVIHGPSKGYEGGHNLRVQKIQGQATQEDIQISIKPFFYDWGAPALGGDNVLPKLEVGATYEMEGYETGGFVGTPGDVFRRGAPIVQTTGPYFREQFIVIKATLIEPIAFAPDMFTDKPALLQGLAESRDGKGVLVSDDWSVIVLNDTTWPKDVEGKQIETWGRYQADAGHEGYKLLDGDWRLVRLEDQVGRDVRLQGTVLSLNGVWWFSYRGIDLYVEDIEHIPGWTSANFGRPIEIQGRLEKALLPRLDQIALKRERDMKEYFIVRNATWKPIPSLLSPERPLPKKSKKVIDGDEK